MMSHPISRVSNHRLVLSELPAYSTPTLGTPLWGSGLPVSWAQFCSGPQAPSLPHRSSPPLSFSTLDLASSRGLQLGLWVVTHGRNSLVERTSGTPFSSYCSVALWPWPNLLPSLCFCHLFRLQGGYVMQWNEQDRPGPNPTSATESHSLGVFLSS